MRVDGRSEEVAGRVVHAPHAIPPLARFDERFLVKKLAAMCVSAIASIVVYLLTGDRSVKSARCPWRLIGRLRVCLNHQYAEDGVYAVTLTVTTTDGRTDSATRIVPVPTHDVAIVSMDVAKIGVVGSTRTVSVYVASGDYTENVQVYLLRSVREDSKPSTFRRRRSPRPQPLQVRIHVHEQRCFIGNDRLPGARRDHGSCRSDPRRQHPYFGKREGRGQALTSGTSPRPPPQLLSPGSGRRDCPLCD